MKIIPPGIPGSLSMYPCTDCGKMFKTTQHLTQHKNRKKLCTLINKQSSEIIILPKKTTSDDLQVTDVVNFIKTAEDIQNLLNEKKIIEEYKNTILTLKEENETLKEQIKSIQQIIKPTKQSTKTKQIHNELKNLDPLEMSSLTNYDDDSTNQKSKNDDDDTVVESLIISDDTTIESK